MEQHVASDSKQGKLMGVRDWSGQVANGRVVQIVCQSHAVPARDLEHLVLTVTVECGPLDRAGVTFAPYKVYCLTAVLDS